MKNGCLCVVAAGLLVSLGACQDMPGALGQLPQQKTPAKKTKNSAPPIQPQAQAQPAVAEKPTPRSPVEETPAAEGSTADAVRRFVADLESAQPQPGEQSEPPVNQPRIAVASPAGNTTGPGPQVVRANGSLTIPQSAAPSSPAAPRVLAVSLLGDTQLKTEAEPETTVSVHEPLDTAAPPEPLTLDKLIEQAQAELDDEPASAEKQWRLSLLLMADERYDEAKVLSDALTPRARALTEHMVEAVTSTADLIQDPHIGPENALQATNNLRDVFRADAELRVPVVQLCSRVTTFGVYEVLPAEALTPYRANRVIVYCEVENFTSEPAGEDEYHALLATRLELLSTAGESVWVHEEQRIEDTARQKREDFFLAQLVTLPADLEPGEYVLKVAVTDQIADKTNEGVHRFRLGAAKEMAAAATP